MNVLFAEDRTPNTSFLRRVFGGDQSNAQLVFDLIFGIAAPVACFVFDPIVFKSNSWGEPLLADYRLLVYFASALQIIALSCWLLAPELFVGSRILGGVLFSGGLFSLLIGLLLLPFSVIGLLVMLIGIFGFVPFVTARTYFRNALRASRSKDGVSTLSFLTVLGSGVLWLSLPVVAHMGVRQMSNTAIQAILEGTPRQQEMATNQLKWLTTVAFENPDNLVTVYSWETDRERKERIKQAYTEITGQDIEERARLRFD